MRILPYVPVSRFVTEQLDHDCGQMDMSAKAAYVKKANTRLETAIYTLHVIEEFQTRKQSRSTSAMFRSTLN